MGKQEDAAAEWEIYKAEIRRLYLVEGRQLSEVEALMKREHNFDKSQPQYMRQFEKWGFSKNLNRRDYEYFSYVDKKRKFEGREGEYDYDARGKRYSSGEMRKRQRRHLPKGFEFAPLPEYGPPTPEGVQVFTPPPARTDGFHIEIDVLPFFQFQRILQESTFFRELSFSYHIDISGIPTNAIIPESTPKSAKDPARFLEAVTIDPTGEGVRSFSSAIINGPPANALFYTISYCAYLSSNNLLPKSNLDRIVEWIVANERHLPLFDFFDPSSPTVVVFMRQLLESAVRLEYTSFMQALLQVCLSSRDSRRILRSFSLLFKAITYNQLELATRILDAGVCLEKFPYYLDVLVKKGYDEMLKLLLSRGLRLDSTKLHEWDSWLDAAVEYGQTEIVKLLLKSKEFDIEDVWELDFFEALVKNEEVSLLLVRAGIDVKVRFKFDYDQLCLVVSSELLFFYPIQTPLQVAAQFGHWELVRFLVEYGADIDLGFSFVGEAKCKAWVDELEDGFDMSDDIPVAVVSALQAAVKYGNIDMTLFLLRKGAKVDARPENKYGHTALQVAVVTGNKDLVNLLLEWKADINARPGFFMGSTALQFAAELQDPEIFKILLKRGGDVKAKAGNGGKTVLQTAAYAGNIELVRFLLRNHFTDVNEPPDSKGGRTALQSASESDAAASIDIMRLLLSAGADSNAPPARKGGITALQAAAGIGNIAKAGLLLTAGAQIEACSDQYGYTALHEAIENCHYEMVTFLLQEGATPFYSASAVTRRTPLQEACWNGDTKIASLLLSKVPQALHSVLINIPASFDSGVTALQAAVKSGNLELTKLLLNLGADPNAPGAAINGKTAVEKASFAMDFKMLQILLERGARFPPYWMVLPQDLDDNSSIADLDLSLRRLEFDYGFTCFSSRHDDRECFCAKCVKPKDFISLVVGSGIDITIFPPVFIKAALRIAIRRKNLHATNFLLSSRALPLEAEIDTGRTGLQFAASIGSMESVKIYIKHGADVNEAAIDHWDGGTALWLAVKHGHVETAKLLLEHGADVEASVRGQTILQAAARKGLAEVVICLVELGGAYVNSPGSGGFGRTALQYATENGHVDVVKYLLERGADVNGAPDHCGGETALQAAAISGHAGILLMLLDAGADVTAPGATESGRTAIEGAAEHGRLDILRILLQVHPRGQSLDEQLERAEELAEREGHDRMGWRRRVGDRGEVLRVIQEHRKSG